MLPDTLNGMDRFADQTSGDNKVPSVICYDKGHKVVAAGDAATSRQAADNVDFEGWTKIELFVIPSLVPGKC